MRNPLHWLYQITEFLAVLSMFLILLLVGGGIVLRALGLQLAGSDDLAAYCLVAIFFLALGPTYRRSEHIRVVLLIERLPKRAKWPVEFVLTLLATVGAAWGTWYIGRFVYDSWRYNDVAGGLLPVPLWIPQVPMLIGAFVLFVALAEDVVRFLRRMTPSYLEAAATADPTQSHFER